MCVCIRAKINPSPFHYSSSEIFDISIKFGKSNNCPRALWLIFIRSPFSVTDSERYVVFFALENPVLLRLNGEERSRKVTIILSLKCRWIFWEHSFLREYCSSAGSVFVKGNATFETSNHMQPRSRISSFGLFSYVPIFNNYKKQLSDHVGTGRVITLSIFLSRV